MSEHVIEGIARLVIGSVHDHAKWAGEEIAGLKYQNNQLEEECDYLKGVVENLKVENAALRKKCEKHKVEA